jgi:hypothetical protein
MNGVQLHALTPVQAEVLAGLCRARIKDVAHRDVPLEEAEANALYTPIIEALERVELPADAFGPSLLRGIAKDWDVMQTLKHPNLRLIDEMIEESERELRSNAGICQTALGAVSPPKAPEPCDPAAPQVPSEEAAEGPVSLTEMEEPPPTSKPFYNAAHPRYSEELAKEFTAKVDAGATRYEAARELGVERGSACTLYKRGKRLIERDGVSVAGPKGAPKDDRLPAREWLAHFAPSQLADAIMHLAAGMRPVDVAAKLGMQPGHVNGIHKWRKGDIEACKKFLDPHCWRELFLANQLRRAGAKEAEAKYATSPIEPSMALPEKERKHTDAEAEAFARAIIGGKSQVALCDELGIPRGSGPAILARGKAIIDKQRRTDARKWPYGTLPPSAIFEAILGLARGKLPIAIASDAENMLTEGTVLLVQELDAHRVDRLRGRVGANLEGVMRFIREELAEEFEAATV